MAKGKLKGNKEAKKPKTEKPKGTGFRLQAGAEQGWCEHKSVRQESPAGVTASGSSRVRC